MVRKRAVENARALMGAAAVQAAHEVRVVTAPARGDAYTEVGIEYVVGNARNVRESLGDLKDLAASIAAEGVLQPLVVRPLSASERGEYQDGARYVVVMGNRRLAAAAIAGRKVLPVVVRSDITRESERQLMLIENLQRQDLSPIEEAKAYVALLGDGVSQRQLAEQIGVTQPHISRRTGLLNLHPDLQRLIGAQKVGVDIAINTLAKLTQPEQSEVAATIGAQPNRRWEASDIKRMADETSRAALVARVREDQRGIAKRAGAMVAESVEDLPESVRGDLRRHRAHDRIVIAEAGRSGSLWAAITDHRDGPEWYVGDTASITAPAPAAGGGIDAIQVADPEATNHGSGGLAGKPEADRVILPVSPTESTAVSPSPSASTVAATAATQHATTSEPRDSETAERDLANWVRGHRKMKRAELVDIAGFLLESLPHDADDPAGRLARSWLAPEFDGDWAAWKQSLAAASRYDDDAIRAAWAYTVAADLLASRDVPDSSAGHRTAARLDAAETEN